jgi:hypothetical protein
MTQPRSTRALLGAWERTAATLPSGYDFGLDDWLNDLDGRRLLAAALGDDTRRAPTFRARLAAADRLVRAATKPFPLCLWGSKNAERHGYDRTRHWFYFVVPTRHGDEFAADLARVR